MDKFKLFWLIDTLYTVFTILLNPFILALLLLLIAVFLKRKLYSKILITISLAILYISSTTVLPSYLLAGLEKYKQTNINTIKSHKALILLGAGLEKNASSITPTLLAYSRILEAYRIYSIARQNDVNYKVIITGGDVRKYGISEAEVYGKILEELGVQKSDLLLEKQSLNTYQNARYTKKVIKDLPYKEYLLVTSSIHMKRSLLYFKEFGIDVVPSISDTPKPISSWIPLPYNLTLLSFAIHEYLSIFRLYTYDYFGLNNTPDSTIFLKSGQ